MARRPLGQDELLKISEHCAGKFLRSGETAPTVAELAEDSGLSERSFYRYFPTKEDSLRPLFDHGNRFYAQAIDEQPAGTDFLSALEAAFIVTLERGRDRVSVQIMDVVLKSPALRQIWLEASYQAFDLLRAPLARLLGSTPGSLETTVACGQAVVFMLSGLERMTIHGLDAGEAARAVAHATANLTEHHARRRPAGTAGKEPRP
ncbi:MULTISPECIES: TetR/AcrR family transcriptional regulator [Arthrobacter]|uniref:TetR/AcrR family transcriptional regulator n=2 Tax=Arthrobacter TaxID=1663 RepID=A0ABU9KI01_9MICC|nr:TetR/AcrR family transcriptional regulator [Arthrobacter sp. YJM1]MDP5226468.1 TetR/AcrR family transcriptional regulator [Arthrobacter sp. YJM1]